MVAGSHPKDIWATATRADGMTSARVRPATVERGARAPAGVPDARRVEAYRWMVLARLVDERCLTLQRQGRIGFYVPLEGQEAAQIGCALALEAADWIFPAYRELGLALVRGVPLETLFDQFIGNSGDVLKGRQMPNHYGYRDRNFVVASSPVGTQITQAVGAGLAARRRGDAIATIAFFGDGTTSSNDFHAGLNFAGVFRAPTIFFCQNNQWAISLPRAQQTHSATLAEKARAYGFEGVVVDGMAIDEVYRAVRQARERAVAGDGPTLIEAQVYRFGPHSTSDDPKRYRPAGELEKWKQHDPVAGFRDELIREGRLTVQDDEKLWEAARAEVASAWKTAESKPPVDPLSFLDDVFAQPTRELEDDRRRLAALLAQREGKP